MNSVALMNQRVCLQTIRYLYSFLSQLWLNLAFCEREAFLSV